MKIIQGLTLEESIRKRLIEAIKLSGKSQKEIAKMTKIKDATLSDYIHKGKFPSIITFALLCNALDVSSDEILGLK